MPTIPSISDALRRPASNRPRQSASVESDDARPVDKAYSGIRAAILSGALPPGEHLREETLAAMTGTSRTPVRDALTRLVGEGLATVVNRHRFVTDFSFDEVSVIFDVRARLEGYAAQIAARNIAACELERLRCVVDDIDAVIAADIDALERFRRLNSQFHAVVIGAAKSAQLRALIAPTLALPLESIKNRLWEQPIAMVRSNDQHREIIAALERGDAQWAAAAMSNHILSTKPKPPPGLRARP